MVIKLQKENEILRDIVFGFNNHLLRMQADCMRYLDPDNTECGRDWFINRMVNQLLDGSEQGAIQTRLKKLDR